MSAMEEDLLRFANQPETRLKAFDIAARHEAAICASTRSEIYGSAEKDFRQVNALVGTHSMPSTRLADRVG